MTAKRCTRCGETKPLEEFGRDRRKRDGRASRCRACQAEYLRAYRKANREAIRERERAYREANREAIRERSREYYERNREAILEQQREHWKANREALLERHREYWKANRESLIERHREWQRAYRARVELEGPRRWAAREPFPAELTEVGYEGAHQRVKSFYGPARLHACSATGCDRQAEEWAYIGGGPETDPHHRIATKTDGRDGTTRELSYSLNPARYAPLCHGCHVRLDRDGVDVFAEDGALFSPLTA